MLGAKASRTLTEGQVTQAIILWLRTVPSSSGQPGLDFLYVRWLAAWRRGLQHPTIASPHPAGVR